MIDTLKKFYYLLDNKKINFYLFISLYFILAALDLFVIAIIYFFISLITNSSLNNSEFLIDTLQKINFLNLPTLYFISFFLIFLIIFKNLYQYILNNYFYFFSYNFQVELKDKILKKININFGKKKNKVDKNEIQKIIIFSTERYVVNALQPMMMGTSDIFLFFMLIIFLGLQEFKAMLFLSFVIIFSFFIFVIYFKKNIYFGGKNIILHLKKLLKTLKIL